MYPKNAAATSTAIPAVRKKTYLLIFKIMVNNDKGVNLTTSLYLGG